MPNRLTATSPKYVAVAHAIESQIRKGKWDGGKMPSVRGIATLHKVSVVTASRALQILRDKGLIQTIERSGCYRVPPPTAERWAVCLRLTPGPWQRATMDLLQSGFEALARREPMHLFEAFDLHAGLTPAEAEQAAVAARRNGVNGVFLAPSRISEADARSEEAFLVGAKAAGLPVVLVERNLRGRSDLLADLVTLDDLGGGTLCTRHLLELDRKRVGIVVGSPTSSHNDRLAGYLFALHGARSAKRPLPEVVIRQPADLQPKEAYAAVAEVVQRERLDGVLCYSDYTALGLVVELLHRGVKVPRDVAVCGFDNLPIGDLFAIELTTYEFPAEAIAEQAIRLMRARLAEPNAAPVRVIVPGRLIVRGSTVAG
jgi:LacI family transcriptional regulator